MSEAKKDESDLSALLCVDRTKLQSLVTQKQMLKNFRGTQAAQSRRVTMDSLYIQVARDEHEMLVDLAIEALRGRLIDT